MSSPSTAPTRQALRRRAVLALLGMGLLPVGGCGFHPLYGEAATAYDPQLAAISVQLIPDRVGQELSLGLRERLNPKGVPTPTRYTLAVTLFMQRADLGIRRDATASRGEIYMTARFVLTEVNSGKALYQAISRANSSFNILDDAFASLVAEQDAQDRSVREITDDISLRLASFLQRTRTAG
jgi:LPS-assembly lipoprotein